jgi:hypothetical protein
MDTEWNSISAQLHGTFVERQIRRTNRNLFVVSLLLIIGVLGYGAAEWRYFYNFFAGPLEASAESLDSVKRPDDQLRYFVTVKGEESSDTGLEEVERETSGSSVRSETVKAKYSVLVIGKRLLIVKRSPRDNGTTFQGALKELPSDLRSQIVAPLLKEYPNAGDAFMPFMLDATGFRTDGYIALLICIPVIFVAMWLVRKVNRRRTVPSAHPIVQSVSRYGSLIDTAQQFDVELRGNTVKFGKGSLTASWFILPSTFGLALCRIPDLVWADKKVTRHYHNFIPTGKTYAVIMYDRYGVPLQMEARQKKIDAVLVALAEKAPWAIFGYSDELNEALRTNWGGLVAAVDDRRSEVVAG